MVEFVAPQVRVGGSPKELLVENVVKCKEKTEDLLAAMRQTMPHGRDYDSEEGLMRARALWLHEMSELRILIGRLERLAFTIDQQ